MCPVPSSLTLNPAQWTQLDLDLLDKSSGQTTLSLVCILVFVIRVVALSFTRESIYR